MPYTWLSFSTMTAPALEGRTPAEIREIVREVAAKSGGNLIEVYFDVGREVAYALIKDLGGSADTKRATRELGGLGVTKILDADQADQALR